MKLTYITLIALLLCCNAYAQELNLRWVNTLPCYRGPIATDNKGNVYISGWFKGTIDVDPGTGVSKLTAVNDFDLFFAKYDATGKFLYARQLRGNDISAMTVDKNGNILIAGHFDTSLDLDPGPPVISHTSSGEIDIFLAKYDSEGKYLASTKAGGLGSDHVYAITTDAQGNVWIGGSIEGTASFYNGTTSATTLVSGGHGTNVNAFMAKYTPDIRLSHALLLYNQTLAVDGGHALATDAAGNLYMAGMFSGKIDLDPGVPASNFTATGTTRISFLAKYDNSGNYQWGRVSESVIRGLTVDANSEVHVCGMFTDSMDADLGTGKYMLYTLSRPLGYNPNLKWWATYTGKYTTAGNFIRARSYKNARQTFSNIAVNDKGTIYLNGGCSDTADLNPGGGGGTVISKGKGDGIVARYDNKGAYTKSMSIGGKGDDAAWYMVIDKSGHLWIAGQYGDSADFDPGPRNYMCRALDTVNTYIACYGDSIPTANISNTLNTDTPPINIFSAQHAIIIDLTEQQQVNANIRVVDMTGRVITTATHDRNDMLRLPLPDAAPQVYAVIVEHAGAITTKKLWVE